MTKREHTLVESPPGVQCFVGAEAARRRAIEDTVVSVFEGWSYEEIVPPLFDYADVFADGALGPKTYSFVGRDGNLLALRPDFTSLVAKIAAGRLAHREPPLRLYYSGEVLRYEPPKAGRQSELYQMGLEHLGGHGASGDAEIVAVAWECLERLGVRDAVLSLGHVGIFQGLVSELGLDPAQAEAVRERVERKDAEGVAAVLASIGRSGASRDALVDLGEWSGDVSALARAERGLAACAPARAALTELRSIVEVLRKAGLGDHVTVDLGEAAGLEYYTGTVFRIYARTLGFEVGGGGRYDTLLGRYGRPLPAVGFMLGLDRVALLLDRQQGAPAPAVSTTEIVAGPDLGGALEEARRRRASGARIRFDGRVGR